MNTQDKKTILDTAKQHVSRVQEQITAAKSKTAAMLKKAKAELKVMDDGADKIAQTRLIEHASTRVGELDKLYPSPYFVRCDVRNDAGGVQQLRFAKFSFSDEKIYSWITPASTIRYEDPGPIRYRRPDGRWQTGELLRKDQYMIVDGNVIFLATEDQEHGRELVHQEHFSTQKKGFVLPEIVERMERAQDAVIRAPHKGPFVISGPAGSGKTTLALHRVAYLIQSPQTAELYPGRSIRVFVQDEGTRDYFGALLPELGINDVEIMTFSSWAKDVLELGSYTIVDNVSDIQHISDKYALAKLAVLRGSIVKKGSDEQVFAYLSRCYEDSFSDDLSKLFDLQIANKSLDNIDLTILLLAQKKLDGELQETKDYFVQKKGFAVERKKGRFPVRYSLAIADEFQNYLPEQLQLIRGCIDQETQSIMYVGDMQQQIRFGTISDWSEIGERVTAERQAALAQVYRNTKSILRYIWDLGYDITIPEQMKEGESVVVIVKTEQEERVATVKEIVENIKQGTIGILAYEDRALDPYRALSDGSDNVRCYTIEKAQGVEFETVILVGVGEGMFGADHDVYSEPEIQKQKKIIDKDLLYIALTRAMDHLIIVGDTTLQQAISQSRGASANSPIAPPSGS